MAVLTGLRYARQRVRVGKTGQRVRLTATVTAFAGENFNLTHPFGEYARVFRGSEAPQFAWASYGTPPFEHATTVSGCEGCTEPRFCWDPRGSIRLLINNGGVIEERVSNDHGYTWEDGVVRFALGTHPDISERGGLILRAAYLAGAITATRQYPGDAAPGAAFNLKNASAVDLAVTDSDFRLVGAQDGRWWLHVKLGAGATTLLYSSDAGASWTVTSGAVTGITSGAHPGMAALHDNTLLAWAIVGTALSITRRSPGDTSWSTPVNAQNHLAVDLSVTNGPQSIAHAYEGPARLLLSGMLTGDTTPRELWSADLGSSWLAFP